MRRRLLILVVTSLLAACSSGSAGTTAISGSAPFTSTPADTPPTDTDPLAPITDAPGATSSTVGSVVVATTDTPSTDVAVTSPSETSTTTAERSIDGRPYEVFVPTSYDASTAVPLVVLLHGYTSNGDLQAAYFGMQPVAEERGFLLVHPDGTVDARGDQFWNATDACCNFMEATVDDSAFLAAVIDDIQQTYAVDPKRIYFVGHSNGGFMSYRMACDHADKVAAVASLAGATFDDASACQPSEPVSVVQIHGTDDPVIGYDGGDIFGNLFPSATATVGTWAAYDGCASTLQRTGTALDLDVDLADAETEVAQHSECPDGIAVELWTVQGGAHSPNLSPAFARSVIDFLLAHPKP
jgi:polyhydroxybutyrate depolymerase